MVRLTFGSKNNDHEDRCKSSESMKKLLQLSFRHFETTPPPIFPLALQFFALFNFTRFHGIQHENYPLHILGPLLTQAHTYTKRPHWITFENRTRGVRRHDHRFIWRPSSLSFPLLRNDVNRFWWLHFVALHFFLVFRFGRQINHSVVSRFPLSSTCTQPIKTFWKKKAAKWKALRTTQYEFGSKWNETTIHRKKFLLLLLSITHTFAEGTMWFEDDNRLSFFQCKGKQ